MTWDHWSRKLFALYVRIISICQCCLHSALCLSLNDTGYPLASLLSSYYTITRWPVFGNVVYKLCAFKKGILNSLIIKQTGINEYGGNIFSFCYMKTWNHGKNCFQKTKQAFSFIRDFRVEIGCLAIKSTNKFVLISVLKPSAVFLSICMWCQLSG